MSLRDLARNAPEGLRITKLERDPDRGFFRARVSVNGTTVPVHHRYGSWRTDGGREVLTPVAAALTIRMREIERREARGDEGDAA